MSDRNNSNGFKNIVTTCFLLSRKCLNCYFSLFMHRASCENKNRTGSIYSCCPDDFGRQEHGSDLIF